ncbi:MAG: hypothetical protein WDW38_000003 [Sanguina aurantia]
MPQRSVPLAGGAIGIAPAAVMSDLPPASGEQQVIVTSVIAEGCHVLVNAVAGAGKTTTVLHIANAMRATGGQMLVLTYNAKLKSETRERCLRMGITNVAVHTYHSAAFNIYGDSACAKDDGILKLLQQPAAQRTAWYRSSRFEVLVVDEAQDMTHLYFALARKLLCDVCAPDVRVVVLGDTRQAIYGFKKADARFLSLASQLSAYAPTSRSWKTHPLATSYRLPPRVANFVNAQLLEGQQVLKSASNADRPQGCVRYLRCNTFEDLPFAEIKSWLDSGLGPSDIFILAPSIRHNTNKHMSPVCILENQLVSRGIRCYAASSDDDRLDEDVCRGKIVIATFHQVKGLERKAVLVFGFDASYHKYFQRNDPSPIACPNTIYVAATRAMLNLTLLHDCRHAPMRTVRMGSLRRDCEFEEDGSRYTGGDGPGSTGVACSTKAVTDSLRHLTTDVLNEAFACVSITPLDDAPEDGREQHPSGSNTTSTPAMGASLKSKIRTDEECWENVSAIRGIALPCMFELKTSGKCTLLTRAARDSRSLPESDFLRIKQLDACKDPKSLTTADFLFIANIHLALVQGYTHKLRQITAYDWLDEGEVCAMMEVMHRYIQGPPAGVRYEVPAALVIDLPVARRKVKLTCAVDCLDPSTNTAFEIKCVPGLSTEDFLQTALNGLLLEAVGRPPAPSGALVPCRYKHVLLNLHGGDAFEVDLGVGGEGAMRAAVILLEAKFAVGKSIDDAAFLASTVIGPAFGQYQPVLTPE